MRQLPLAARLYVAAVIAVGASMFAAFFPQAFLWRGEDETVSQLLCRPSGTQLCFTLLPPALTCRAFLCRRFAAGGMVQSTFFAALGVATQNSGTPGFPQASLWPGEDARRSII